MTTRRRKKDQLVVRDDAKLIAIVRVIRALKALPYDATRARVVKMALMYFDMSKESL